MKKVIIFDSHPVQYRVPIWRELSKNNELIVKVIYASDCSVNGYHDANFGQKIVWDDPMLDGYIYTFLKVGENSQPNGFFSLKSTGITDILRKEKPDYVFLTGVNYLFDWKALFVSKIFGFRVGLRCDTHDEASLNRGYLKSLIRTIIYTLVYSGINNFFYVGERNKRHFLNLKISKEKMIPSFHFTIDRFKNYDNKTKFEIRKGLRNQNDISEKAIVLGFCGKLYNHKNAQILFQIFDYLPQALTEKIVLYFVGSGILEKELKEMSEVIREKYGVKTVFNGFVNQTKIGPHYLCMDILVLPSLSETWGLVVNEALQAGCSIVVGDKVGCGEDFKYLERFRIFRTNDESDLSQKISDLAKFERDFDWCKDIMQKYSLQTTVNSISNVVKI